MRAIPLLALLVAANVAAQAPTATKTPPAQAAGAKAAPAPGTQTKAAPTAGQQTKAAAGAQTKAAAGAQTKVAGPQTKAASGAQTKAAAGAQTKTALTVAPEAVPQVRVPVIMREVFEYDNGGRRDPFVSLLMSPDLSPTVADLRLVGVLYDESGRRPVAIMRDLANNTQYRVTTGMALGRMRVSAIKRRSVIFTIEEFGLNRQDSLVLGDTTKVRAR